MSLWQQHTIVVDDVTDNDSHGTMTRPHSAYTTTVVAPDQTAAKTLFWFLLPDHPMQSMLGEDVSLGQTLPTLCMQSIAQAWENIRSSGGTHCDDDTADELLSKLGIDPSKVPDLVYMIHLVRANPLGVSTYSVTMKFVANELFKQRPKDDNDATTSTAAITFAMDLQKAQLGTTTKFSQDQCNFFLTRVAWNSYFLPGFDPLGHLQQSLVNAAIPIAFANVSEECIQYFHGTTMANAQAILTNGVKVNVWSQPRDLGPAFYMTESYGTALYYARLASGNSTKCNGAVLGYLFPKEYLSRLRTFVANMPDQWSNLVSDCRMDRIRRPRKRKLGDDVVSTFLNAHVVGGPISENAIQFDTSEGEVALVMSNYHQIAFRFESDIDINAHLSMCKIVNVAVIDFTAKAAVIMPINTNK